MRQATLARPKKTAYPFQMRLREGHRHERKRLITTNTTTQTFISLMYSRKTLQLHRVYRAPPGPSCTDPPAQHELVQHPISALFLRTPILCFYETGKNPQLTNTNDYHYVSYAKRLTKSWWAIWPDEDTDHKGSCLIIREQKLLLNFKQLLKKIKASNKNVKFTIQ